MIVKSLKLKNFRNYDLLNLEFDSATNIFYGDNAQGKTNILESAAVSATTKSHKGSRDKEMIRFEQDDAHIRMFVDKRGIEHKIDIHLKKNKTKIIWTFHDCWAFTGHCAYFDFVQCDKWKTACQNCPQYRNSYPYALFKDGSKGNYARKMAAFQGVKGLTIVTPSRWLGGQVKESYLQEYPVKVIPNGIDLERFVPRKTEQRKKHLVLGVANVWDRRKGLDYLKQLSELLDKEKYEVAVVGVSKKQIKELPQGMIGIEHTQSLAR